MEEALLLLLPVPNGLVKSIIRLLIPHLMEQAETEQGIRFTIGWVGIVLGCTLDGGPEEGLASLEQAAFEQQFAILCIAAVVFWIAPQGFLEIRFASKGCMSILLEMYCCQVQLLNGFDALGFGDGLCRLRIWWKFLGVLNRGREKDFTRIVEYRNRIRLLVCVELRLMELGRLECDCFVCKHFPG